MESKDWKEALGAVFNITAEETDSIVEQTPQQKSAIEQQGKKMIDILLDKKGRNGKKATIIVNLDFDEKTLKEMAAHLKRICGVGGSARGGEILIQGDMRDIILRELKNQGFNARII